MFGTRLFRLASRPRGSLVLAVGTVAAALCSGAIADGVSADGSPVVHACYTRPGGALRLGSVCRTNERPVSWSQTGPAGPSGPAGPQGVQGPVGSEGPRGTASTTVVTASDSVVAHALAPGLPPPPGTLTATASCPSGAAIAGGGQRSRLVESSGVESGGADEIWVTSSYPSSSAAWTVEAALTPKQPEERLTITAYAICVS